MASPLLGRARGCGCQKAPLVMPMRHQLWESLLFGHEEAKWPPRARKWLRTLCCPLPTSTASVWTTPLSRDVRAHTSACLPAPHASAGLPHLPGLPLPTSPTSSAPLDTHETPLFLRGPLEHPLAAHGPCSSASPVRPSSAEHPSLLRAFREHPGAPGGRQGLGQGRAGGDN